MLGWLGDLLGLNKGQGTIEAAGDNRNIITDYGNKGRDIIGAGYQGAGDYLRQVLDLTGMAGGSRLYGDAIGANGVAGNERAREAFTSSPGFQHQLDTGLQALDRRRAASGGFSSGGADLDTLTFSQGLASQDWNNWLTHLTGGVDRATGALNSLAGLETGNADALLGLEGDVAGGLTSANNMTASGKEAGQGALWSTLGNIAGVAGAAFGLPQAGGFGGWNAKPQYSPGFGGYGSF